MMQVIFLTCTKQVTTHCCRVTTLPTSKCIDWTMCSVQLLDSSTTCFANPPEVCINELEGVPARLEWHLGVWTQARRGEVHVITRAGRAGHVARIACTNLSTLLFFRRSWQMPGEIRHYNLLQFYNLQCTNVQSWHYLLVAITGVDQ
jgi:hypothetical protein